MRKRLSPTVERRRRRVQPSPGEALHGAVADYLDSRLPRDAVWLRVPAGPERQTWRGAGKGVPEILIFWNRRAFCIALPDAGRRPSDDERAMRARLQNARIPIEVARSFAEFRAALADLGLAARESET